MIRGFVRTILIGLAVIRAAAQAFRNPLAPAAPPRRSRRTLKQREIEYGLLFAGLGLLGFLVVVSGFVPIRASAGHWAITRWFLEFSMARSISTHAMLIKTPPLNDPALVIRGAAAYHLNCRPCHGSPELQHPRVAAAMLPRPPYLPQIIENWSPRELFYIVKHGVKFTGMPAWPSQKRDDEVWAVVAFILELPKLDAGSYQRLVQAPAETTPLQTLAVSEVPRTMLESCGRCHGTNGIGRAGIIPRLAGQRPAYLFNALQAFARGRRHSGIMEPVAAGLSVAQMRALARHFSAISSSSSPARRITRNPSRERGMTIAIRGLPAQNVPPCAQCHGPQPSRKNDAYPILSGQSADYLVLQLQLFKAGHRGGSRFAHLMRPVAGGLSIEQMRDVAVYYETLGAR